MKSDKFLIRKIKNKELSTFSQTLITVEKALRRRSNKLWEFDKLMPDKLKEIYKPSNMYLLFVEGAVAGTIILQETDLDYWQQYKKESNCYYIHKLSLLPKYTGKGLSKKILDWAEGEAISAGKTYLRLDCNKDRGKVCKIYEDFGFKRKDIKTINGREVVLYEKNVDLILDVYKKSNFFVTGASQMKLLNGKGFIVDLISGVNSNIFGFKNIYIKRIAKKQIDKYIHASNYHTSDSQINILKKLNEMTHFNKYFFTNSSSEANEAMLTILNDICSFKKNKIITFQNSFFGRTYGCRKLNSGGNYDSLTVLQVPPNDLKSLKSRINNETLAVYLELIQGHGGIVEIKKEIIEYLKMVRHKFNFKIIVDETLTGVGRCNFPFLYQKFNLQPDAIIIGKAVGGGFPLAVLCLNNEMSKLVSSGIYGSTLGGNAVACACGEFILNEIGDEKKMRKINKNALYLRNKLLSLEKKFDFKLLGKGFLLGLQFKNSEMAKRFRLEAFKKRLFFDIVGEKTVRLMPPINISKKTIDFIVNKINKIFEVILK